MVISIFFKIVLFYIIIVTLYHFYLIKDLDYRAEITNNKFSMMYHVFLIMFFPVVLFLAVLFTYMVYLGCMYIIGLVIKFFS